MTYHRIGNKSNTTGATCGEGTNILVCSKYTVHLTLHNSSRRGQNRMVDTFTSIYGITKVNSITPLTYVFSLQLITFVKLNKIFSFIFCSMSYATKPYKTDFYCINLFLFCLETSEIKA
jgi:hypothetical protein